MLLHTASKMLFMEKPFTITFPTGATAEVVQVDPSVDLQVLVREMGLERHQPVLVVIGGASKLSQADFNRVRRLFTEVLAPLAEKWQATVIDGGTDAGVMRLMGQARLEEGGTFPLVGVIPIGLAILPGQSAPSSDAAPLEPNHTHFVLIPGSNWGDESAWIANLATTLSNAADSVTVLINGGEVSWIDASQSIQSERSLIVVAGSGRTADVLATALRGNITDSRAEAIVASGLVRAIDLDTGADTLAKMIEEIFAPKP
ncbi:MAG: hypothetical protein K6T90_15010 [Leptolyngbyaceae cyanobacterium HOT.MB2.61]|nr:hypothetical protein [Leptolyngbyaceae cyanobacterium HOT.MB2.61]